VEGILAHRDIPLTGRKPCGRNILNHLPRVEEWEDITYRHPPHTDTERHTPTHTHTQRERERERVKHTEREREGERAGRETKKKEGVADRRTHMGCHTLIYIQTHGQ
jgi:hypothetical protein